MAEVTVPATRRTVLVTGAASGIGKAIADAFATHGSRVVLLDRDEIVHDVARELGADHTGFVVDITSEDEVVASRQLITAMVGPIDVLVNNAGIARLGPVAEFTMPDWDELMATNLRGAFLCARTFGPDMVAHGWGRIIQIASENAECGLPGHVAYSTAKAGLLGMMRVMAVEWGPNGVTVNAVSPTLVDTPMSQATWTAEQKEKLLELIPTRRLALMSDVASAVTYLASESAGMINGQNLVVDGGSSIVT